MAPKRKTNGGGGLKGFFSRASKSFLAGGIYSKDKSYWLAEKLAKVGLILATTSIIVFMPLVFEIAREGQVREHHIMIAVHSHVCLRYVMFLCDAKR